MSQYDIATTKALDCLGQLPVISPAARGAGNLMLANQHAPLFPIHLVEKDFCYVLQTAQAMGAETPISNVARGVYWDAIANSHGNHNITGIAQLFVSQ